MNTPKKASAEFWESITALGLPSFIIVTLIIVWGTVPTFPIVKSLLLYAGVEVSAALIKLLYKTDRPTPETKNSFFEKYQSGSFPSIHTARITYLSAILAVSGILPPFFSLAMFALTSLVAASRVILKKHFLVDILGGFALGVLLAIVFKFL